MLRQIKKNIKKFIKTFLKYWNDGEKCCEAQGTHTVQQIATKI